MRRMAFALAVVLAGPALPAAAEIAPEPDGVTKGDDVGPIVSSVNDLLRLINELLQNLDTCGGIVPCDPHIEVAPNVPCASNDCDHVLEGFLTICEEQNCGIDPPPELDKIVNALEDILDNIDGGHLGLTTCDLVPSLCAEGGDIAEIVHEVGGGLDEQGLLEDTFVDGSGHEEFLSEWLPVLQQTIAEATCSLDHSCEPAYVPGGGKRCGAAEDAFEKIIFAVGAGGDSDEDGTRDCEDLDDDNDVLSDRFEDAHGLPRLDPNQDKDHRDGAPLVPLIDGFDLNPHGPEIEIGLLAKEYDAAKDDGCDTPDSTPETYLTANPVFTVPGLGQNRVIRIPEKWTKNHWDEWNLILNDEKNPTNEEMRDSFVLVDEVLDGEVWNVFTDDGQAYSTSLRGELEIQLSLHALREDDVVFDDDIDIGPVDVKSLDLSVDLAPGANPQTMLWQGGGNCWIRLSLELKEVTPISGDIVAAVQSNWNLGKVPGDAPFD